LQAPRVGFADRHGGKISAPVGRAKQASPILEGERMD
jgi:hypothetical protein